MGQTVDSQRTESRCGVSNKKSQMLNYCAEFIVVCLLYKCLKQAKQFSPNGNWVTENNNGHNYWTKAHKMVKK